MLSHIIISVYKDKTIVSEFHNRNQTGMNYNIYVTPNHKHTLKELHEYKRKNSIILSSKNIEFIIYDESKRMFP